jgi:predicted phage terminase large subunit-like protein
MTSISKTETAINNLSLSIPNIELLLSKVNTKHSLHEFIKQAWPAIEGGVKFIDSWHIQAIAEHLEACYRRDIKKLLINIPPRTSKSTIVSVMFPAWVWLHNPEEKFLYSSYAGSLSIEHSLKCRRLIESNWYQERFGNLYQLSRDQKAKGFFDNNKKGSRIATSVGASATGKGGNFLIVDDGNNVQDGESEVKRKATIEWLDSVWSTRLNNPKNDVQIIIQQRLHEEDITGHIIDNDLNNEWVKLILPMEYEESRKAKTIVLPSTDGKVWQDPREAEGELLCEQRFSLAEINQYKHRLGSYGYAGQYQQRPAPEEGGIIQKSWFKWWKHDQPPEIQFIVQSWDTALTANEMSAYSACTTWGVFYDHNHIENLMLLSSWRGRVEYPELREMAKRLFFDYRDNEKDHNPKFKGRQIDMCLVEAKASGDPLIQDLYKGGIKATAFNPTKYGDKIQRVRLTTPIIEGGRVWLRAQAPKYDRLMAFSDDFLQEVATFPNSSSRDLVDTMTQALLKLRDGHFILNPRDERPEPPNDMEPKIVY